MTDMSKETSTPVSMPGDPTVDAALAATMGLSAQEWERVLKSLGRTPTLAELGVFSAMWSEHCSYKSSRIHLGRLPTKGPRVVQGPGENAGAVDIGDGYCAVFKMESHNHPSYVEPYQGAATGVGGILRDVFTMGARPVASLNSLRFGDPALAKTKQLIRGVVAGIGGYGNSIGVPTVGGEVYFDESYNGNCLVNAFTVGVAKTNSLFFGKASGEGNLVIYVGARTGRDGIHGATMASQEFGASSESKLPTVQVGDPFMEKLLLEACLEIFASGCIVGVQDMGAAGLTSASVEMAARAEMGLELDLDAIPRRTRGLSPYEMLLSESQERMLMVCEPGREKEVFVFCKKWNLDAAVVGKVTTTGRFICKATPHYDPWQDASPNARGKHATQVVVDIPVPYLTDDAPKYDRPQKPPTRGNTDVDINALISSGNERTLEDEILSLLRSPNIGSRRPVWRQFDHIVRDGTVIRPGESDAAVIRVFTESVPPQEKYLALSVDGNGRHVYLDPYQGAAMVVAECARNIVCSGGEPLGLTDCLNFGNPQNPEIMWQFSQAIDGLRDACEKLNVPVVSGNVSLYNETNGQAILPTPAVAIVGQLASPEDRLTLAFKREGDHIAIIGPVASGLGGSEWLYQRQGRVAGKALSIDLDLEARVQATLLELARKHILSSAHDVSDGGLAVCLAESCIKGQVGCVIDAPLAKGAEGYAALFSESPSRIVLSYSPEHANAVESSARSRHVPFARLGIVKGSAFEWQEAFCVDVSACAQSHDASLDALFEAG